MRELQSILNNYISNTEKQKRHLAILVTLSLLVSFIVPYVLVEPADSLTKDSYNLSYFGADILSSEGNMVSNLNGGQDANIVNGVAYSPGQLSEVTLLIGDGVDWAEGCLTAEDVIEAAKREYFLGIASDFCVFLEGDFLPRGADAEGRVAVGGNIDFNNTYNYQLGSGDYATMTALINTDNYEGITNFAHAIVGGYVKKINTLSTVGKGSLYSQREDANSLYSTGSYDAGTLAVYYPEDEDLYKRIAISKSSDINNCKHMTWLSSNGWAAKEELYNTGCEHDKFKPNELAQFYQADLINFNETFDWLENQSEKLSNKNSTGKVSFNEAETVVTFTGPGKESDITTIYFELDSWNPKIKEIRFEDVPPTANLVVNCGGNIVSIDDIDSTDDVDNFDSNQTSHYKNRIKTYINDEMISNDDNIDSNNNVKSEQILYNFYECGLDQSNLPTVDYGDNESVAYSLLIDVNFNGTILAPYAKVASAKECNGHLSGALIAQSFEGGLEFGYRPYRGTTDILGSTAGYVVPFDKLAPDGEYLEGASFVIKDENDNIVESWKSGTDTQYITLPSELDLEGGTTYTEENKEVSHTYIVEEQSAPEGYIKTDKTYKIKITETVDLNSLLSTESGTLPTKVLVNLEIYENGSETPIDSRVLTITDTYSDEGIIQRIVCIEDDGAKQYFVLDINAQDGSINSVGVPTADSLALLQNDTPAEDNGTESNDGAAVVFDDLTLDYQQPDVLEGEETGDGTEGEVTEGEDTGDSTEGETSLFPEGYEAPTLTAIYGQTLADVDFPEVSYGSWAWNTPSDSVGNVGTNTFTATFTPTDEEYTAQEVELQVTVEPATPTPPDPITVPYGTWLRDISLPSDGNGAWSWQNPDQTGNNLYAFSYQANYTPYNNNYKAISVDVSVTFTKADPPYVLPTGLTAIYGETLADVELPYADNGTWTWQADLTTSVGPAGTSSFIAVFTPNDSNYNTVTPTVQITVNKADPECTFPTNLKATYGQTLADVTGLPTVDNGHFEWEQSSDTVGNAGTNYKNLKFIPNDQNNYNVLTQSVAVEVSKADPNPTVPTNLTVTYGKTLADVTFPTVSDGSWAWAEGVDTDAVILDAAGSELTFNAIFTPSDTNNYNTANADITLTVVKAKPTVNPVISEGPYGQLEALPTINLTTGDTEGTIEWVSPDSKLKYGENVLEWKFVPTDTTNYEEKSGTITITAAAIATTKIDISDLKTEKVITLGTGENAVDYYYDPTSMMIMPLPEPTPSFTNEYGLVFKKLDDGGNLLPGATISLQSGTINADGEWVENTELSKPTWDWTDGTSSSATIPVSEINVNELEVNVVYRFYETAAPSEDYEIAKPIYFVKRVEDEKTIIRYTDDETILSNTDSWDSLDLSEGQYTIAMTDRGIYGAAVTLKKTDSTGTISLDGAEFELHALKGSGSVPVYPVKTGEDGKLVLDDSAQKIVVSNGEINLYDFFNSVDSDTYNTAYVKNGYLVPGAYYLNETKAPNGYEAPTGEFYFTVEENSTGDGYVIKAEKVEIPDSIPITLTTVTGDNANKQWYVCLDGSTMNDNSSVTISGVSSIKVKLSSNAAAKFYVDNGEISTGNGKAYYDSSTGITTAEFDTAVDLTKIEIQGDSWGVISVSSIEITTADGTIYTLSESSGADDSISKDYGDGITVSSTSISIDTTGLSRIVTDEMIANDSVVLSFTFNTSSDQMGWGNAKFTGNVNGSAYTQTSSSYLPSGCNLSEYNGAYNIGFQQTAVTLNLTVSEICKILGVETSNFSAIKEFGISTWNSTTLSNISFANLVSDDSSDTEDTAESEENTDSTQDNSNLITVNGMEISIGNNVKGQYTSIEVVKNWADDEGFTTYRPESITVQLYQATAPDAAEKTAYGEPITLSEENGWKYTWSKIPGLVAGTTLENPSYYYYSIAEITPDEDYTVSYSNNGGIDSGSITITNTLKTINLPVKKVWDTKGNTGITLPTEIEVKLQMKVNGEWTDVTGKTLELNADNSWSGTFEDLPEGETYRAFEENVPDGWLYSPDEVGTSEDGSQLTVTNALDVGKLTLKKLWSGDAASNRPGSIKLNIYRTTTKPGSGTTGGGTTGGDYTGDVMTPSSVKDENVTEDYARLLQYSLYFYDANMCGDEVTETSVLSWRNNCHTDDAINGGFHDAGDHAIFGLPEGFTASTLGWSYYEYKNTFDSLGLTNHYKIIMKEFCDFFTDSTTITNGEVTKLLYQKGDGNTDHSYWGAPETQPSRSSQMFYTTNGASDIAADYAAALAQYALIFPSDTNSQTYLETAEALYDFSTKYNTRTSEGASGFYWDENGSCNDEQAWAAAWLYLATKDDSYKTACETKLNSCGAIPERGHFWDDVTLGAECVYNAHINPNSTTASEWSKVTNYLNTYCTGDSYRVLNSWGSTRHNTLLQLAALVTDKNMETTNYQAWCKSQMAYILGNNSIASNGNSSTCFVAGFASNSSKYPHHRAASGYASGETRDNSKYDTDGHVLLGALIGGPNANGGYVDKMDGEDLVWQTNEVTIDYNAGLVGAAAALYSVYGTGHTVTESVMVEDGLELKEGKHTYEYQYQSDASPASVDDEETVDYSAMNLSFDTVSVMAAETLTYTISGINFGETYTVSLPNVKGYKIEASSTGVINFGFNLQFNDSSVGSTNIGWAQNTTLTYENTLSTSIDVSKIVMNETRTNNSDITVTLYVYYESDKPSVTIENAPTSSLKIDDTHQLSATYEGGTVAWKSSSDKVSVDSTGKVTINGYPDGGKATITAYDASDETINATVEITVEAMTLTPSSSDVVVGDTVTYSSNYNNAVIQSGTGYSVSENEITAESEGNHTVTANAGNASATAALNVSALQITGGTDTMGTGATATFGVNGQTDGHTFKWTSSNSAVLSINEGTGAAEALKSGTATITVTKDDKYTATYSVTVQKGALGISIEPSRIHVGKTAILSAVNDEGQTVVYSSSDETKATISGNTVTAIGEGTVTITGTLGNENPTCTLEIVANPTITAPDENNLIGTNDTLQLYADNIIGTAVWSSLDETVLTVSDTGLVTPVKAGKASIRVTDTDGTYADYEITVQLEKAEVTLPSDAKLVDQVTLLPDNNWQKEIENLPKYDENGNPYYYYIVELDSNGSVADTITGSGAIYVPTKYENNGTVLGDDTEISVENTLTDKVEGQMPSTGGEGSEAYYIYGIILMLCSIAGYTVIKLRRGRRS